MKLKPLLLLLLSAHLGLSGLAQEEDMMKILGDEKHKK
jgi:hypothetical protein